MEGKDIVIGMLQTLSTKDLNETIVKEFGLTVYDECHHLRRSIFKCYDTNSYELCSWIKWYMTKEKMD